MMKNILRSGAFLLALTLAPLATAGAHDKHGRKHRHGRKTVTQVVHVNHRNPTPGIPRRVRRGRNTTPGVRRGPFTTTTTTTIIKPRKNRVGAAAALGGGHKRGHGKH